MVLFFFLFILFVDGVILVDPEIVKEKKGQTAYLVVLETTINVVLLQLEMYDSLYKLATTQDKDMRHTIKKHSF